MWHDQGNESDVANFLSYTLKEVLHCLKMQRIAHISGTRCRILMAFRSKCMIWNAQVDYMSNSKLNIADIWLISLDRVTNNGRACVYIWPYKPGALESKQYVYSLIVICGMVHVSLLCWMDLTNAVSLGGCDVRLMMTSIEGEKKIKNYNNNNNFFTPISLKPTITGDRQGQTRDAGPWTRSRGRKRPPAGSGPPVAWRSIRRPIGGQYPTLQARA